MVIWSVCSAGLLPVVPLSPRPLPHVSRLQRAPEREGWMIIQRRSQCKSEVKVAAHVSVCVCRLWPSVWSCASPSPWWPSTSSSCLARCTGRSPPSPQSHYLSPCPGLHTGDATEQQSRQHQGRITTSKDKAFFSFFWMEEEEEGKY